MAGGLLVVVRTPNVALMTEAIPVAPDGEDVAVGKEAVDEDGGHDH
jgi:hypothetical protein